MSDSIIDAALPTPDAKDDTLPAFFVVGVALVAILVAAAVTLALVSSLQPG